jgi:hypothetical protein
MINFLLKSFTILFLVVITPRFSVSVLEESLSANRTSNQDDFDWISYFETYPEIGRHMSTHDRESAMKHYYEHGKSESRIFPSFYPPRPSLDLALQKLTEFSLGNQKFNVPIKNRTLIIYHVGMEDVKSSVEVFINNLIIMNHSITHDHHNSRNFYWFNVFRGKENNLINFLPSETQENVVKLDWLTTPLEALTRIRTLQFLSDNYNLTHHFGAVFFLNDGVRGPMLYRENGEWVDVFRKLLFNDQDHVGMAASVLSCELSPHLQSHSLMMRSELVSPYVNNIETMKNYKDWKKYNHRHDIFLCQFVYQQLKWNISSLLYFQRFEKTYFDHECVYTPNIKKHDKSYPSVKNPSRWCDLKPEEVIFYKFGGEKAFYVCEDVKEYMREAIYWLSEHEMKDSHLIVPETFQGGPAYDLFNQYELELHRDFITRQERKNSTTLNRYDSSAEKVCLLVRTAKMHDKQQPFEQETFPIETTATGTIDDIIICKHVYWFLCFAFLILNIILALQRQTDPNWEAFFFLTDNQTFEGRLLNILRTFNDSRLTYVDVPLSYRPKVRKSYTDSSCFKTLFQIV